MPITTREKTGRTAKKFCSCCGEHLPIDLFNDHQAGISPKSRPIAKRPRPQTDESTSSSTNVTKVKRCSKRKQKSRQHRLIRRRNEKPSQFIQDILSDVITAEMLMFLSRKGGDVTFTHGRMCDDFTIDSKNFNDTYESERLLTAAETLLCLSEKPVVQVSPYGCPGNSMMTIGRSATYTVQRHTSSDATINHPSLSTRNTLMGMRRAFEHDHANMCKKPPRSRDNMS